MSDCRWDREAEDYLTDDGPCRHDEYGDPTRHCRARYSCANHVGSGEVACARCVGRTRADIRRITDIAPLMLPVAISQGVDSEAANLAGPAANVLNWTGRRVAMRAHLATWHQFGRITERQYLHARSVMEDDDERHPYTVLTRWEAMLREDYRTPHDSATSTTAAGNYLERVLHRVAQDDEQDFQLLAREMRNCRSHLEMVLEVSIRPERGAPCQACREQSPDAPAPRLTKRHGHWCTEDDCERLHYLDDSHDEWVCPRNKAHRWTEEDYRKWVADWHDDTRAAVR